MTGTPQMVLFCATGKTGLGHLRRVTAVAAALGRQTPGLHSVLVTNADPARLPAEDRATFARIETAERAEMAGVAAEGGGPVVVDTAVLPGLAKLDRPLVLVLRETPPVHQPGFALERGRRWDLVIVPNPAGHWQPDPEAVPAGRTEAVGWIWRPVPAPMRSPCDLPQVLVATGGGGTDATAAGLRTDIDLVIAAARTRARFRAVQALGPGAHAAARLDGADEVIVPGGALAAYFAGADAVISTTGYNSVLELAGTDVPALLVPVPRRYDDQAARAAQWGPLLGACHRAGDTETSSAWLATCLATGARRPPVRLGPSGTDEAARLIAELTR